MKIRQQELIEDIFNSLTECDYNEFWTATNKLASLRDESIYLVLFDIMRSLSGNFNKAVNQVAEPTE